MRSGTSMMYAQQAPAFSARNQILGTRTDSTPDTPPTHPPINVEELCLLKRRIVSNLPEKCCHCQAVYPPNSFVERTDGDIMAYCKLPGACGRSLVLFAGVELTKPVYVKICPFSKAVPPVENNASLEVELPSENATTTPSIVIDNSDIEAFVARQYEQTEQRDWHDIHGIPRPDDRCILCDKLYKDHDRRHNECDQNGWILDHKTVIREPANWPKFNARTNTWTNAL